MASPNSEYQENWRKRREYPTYPPNDSYQKRPRYPSDSYYANGSRNRDGSSWRQDSRERPAQRPAGQGGYYGSKQSFSNDGYYSSYSSNADYDRRSPDTYQTSLADSSLQEPAENYNESTSGEIERKSEPYDEPKLAPRQISEQHQSPLQPERTIKVDESHYQNTQYLPPVPEPSIDRSHPVSTEPQYSQPPVQQQQQQQQQQQYIAPVAPMVNVSKPETPGLGIADILKIEMTVRSLQKNLKVLMDEAPDMIQYETSIKLKEKQTERLNFLKLAAQLKTYYKEGKLPLFDELISFDPKKSLESMTITSDVKLETEDYTNKETQLAIKTQVANQGFAMGAIPPLPAIEDPQVINAIFNRNTNEPSDDHLQFERFLALGDSLLRDMVGLVTYKKFALLGNDIEIVKGDLANMFRLNKWATDYSFDKSLNQAKLSRLHRLDKVRILADTFVAYIGGLAFQFGPDINPISSWLRGLLEPVLLKYDVQHDMNVEADKTSKTTLYAIVGSNVIAPKYETLVQGDSRGKYYIVKCIFDGEDLGTGSARNLKDASLKAASDALKDKEGLQRFNRKTTVSPFQLQATVTNPQYGGYNQGYQVPVPNSNQEYRQQQMGAEPPMLYDRPDPNGYYDQHQQFLATQPRQQQPPQQAGYVNGVQPQYPGAQYPGANSPAAAVSQELVHVGGESLFPIHLPPVDDIDMLSKDRLYKILGHNGIARPEYFYTPLADGFECRLMVGDLLVSISIETNKKKASQRAAMLVVTNETALKTLGVTKYP